MSIRTRFAPSPTGFLHVGGIRTALFAYLVARQAGGQLVLRLEDTDKKREVIGSAEHLLESLEVIGIHPSEGPAQGGPYGPYRQSERLDIYQAWAQKLIDAGLAYADPYTPEELEAFRAQAQAEKRAFRYQDHRPENPPMWDGTMPLRFKSTPVSYQYNDEVMGEITTHADSVNDFVLIKSDGYPTYDFAHIVDDFEMKISHVIRGQEFISSMPKYLALYEALGIKRPIFAHLPHIMNERGNKKLGKRDGAKDVLDYIRDGYLPEALTSFIATLGWNDGSEQEVFTEAELIEKFSLKRIGRSGARFDEKRLLWVNGHFIRQLPLDELARRVESFWPQSAANQSPTYRLSVLQLAQDRLKTLSDLAGLTDYFFTRPAINFELIDSNKQLKKRSGPELADLIDTVRVKLAALGDWNPETIQGTLNQSLAISGEKPGVLFSLIRICTTWAPFSPQLNDTLALLGQAETIERLDQASSALGSR